MTRTITHSRIAQHAVPLVMWGGIVSLLTLSAVGLVLPNYKGVLASVVLPSHHPLIPPGWAPFIAQAGTSVFPKIYSAALLNLTSLYVAAFCFLVQVASLLKSTNLSNKTRGGMWLINGAWLALLIDHYVTFGLPRNLQGNPLFAHLSYIPWVNYFYYVAVYSLIISINILLYRLPKKAP